MNLWKKVLPTLIGRFKQYRGLSRRAGFSALFFTVACVALTACENDSGLANNEQSSRPDFNGIWLLASSPLSVSSEGSVEADVVDEEEDLAEDWGFDTRPELKGKYLQDYQDRKKANELAGRAFKVTCKPGGMPTLIAGVYANEILQNENQINWFQEFPGETWRIYLDGRPHPNPEEVVPTLTGHTIGTWEGDTLVVETEQIRTDTLLFGQGRSEAGLGHSEDMRIVQRMRLIDKDLLQIKGTVEDPKALVEPWNYTLTYRRQPGEAIVEYLCEDNDTERLDPVTGQEITEIPERRNP